MPCSDIAITRFARIVGTSAYGLGAYVGFFLNGQTRFARLHCSAFDLDLLFMSCKESTLFTYRYVRPDPLLKHNKKNIITIIGTGKIYGNSLDIGWCKILSFYSFGTGGKRFPIDNTPKVIQNVNKIVKIAKKIYLSCIR